MADKITLSKETFLQIAKDSGLETQVSHLDALYGFLQGFPPIQKAIEDLDLGETEPFMPSFVPKEPLP